MKRFSVKMRETSFGAGNKQSRRAAVLTPSIYFVISRISKESIMSEVYKALADPTRRRILELLRDGEMNAGDLAGHV